MSANTTPNTGLLQPNAYADPYQGLTPIKRLQVHLRIAAQLLTDAYNYADTQCDDINSMEFIASLDSVGEQCFELADQLDHPHEL